MSSENDYVETVYSEIKPIYVDAVEGVFPITSNTAIVRQGVNENPNAAPAFVNKLILTTPETNYTLAFASETGRDAAYSEILNGLGRNTLIRVGKYQHWEQKFGRTVKGEVQGNH